VPIVTIDDRELTVAEDTTILTAARKLGIWIPTLCYNEALSSSGSCRICMVELESGSGKSKLVTACNYPIRKDIRVLTSSPRALEARRGIMELLLARSPESGELKELAARMGVAGTPYPTVTESQRSCILCGMCVKVCEEVIGCSAIGFTGRGINRLVATPFKLAADECIACGACAAVCPVGTIQIRIHEETAEAEISPFKSRAKLLICEECGAKMVTAPVGEKMLKDVKIDWEEFRVRARLCPVCRRKRAAESLAILEKTVKIKQVKINIRN
jgi:bidirectional [NiFe] hydrogenase diaphorase subunit